MAVALPRARALLRAAPLLVMLAAIAAAAASGLLDELSLDALARRQAGLHALVHDHPAVSLLAAVLLMTALLAALIPVPSVLAVAAGYLLGGLAGGACALVAATLGSLALYAGAKGLVGEPGADSRLGRLVLSVRRQLGRHAFSALVTLRVLPVAPYALTNIAAGLAGAPLRTYLAASLLGLAPMAFIYASVGAGLARAFTAGASPNLGEAQRHVAAPLAALALLSALPGLLRWLQARRRRAAGRLSDAQG